MKKHVLFLLDGYNVVKSGVYGLHRYLMRKLSQTGDTRVSCLVVKPLNDIAEDVADARQYDITLIPPNDDGCDEPLRLHCITEHYMHCYQDLEGNARDVTHLVAYAPQTVAAADEIRNWLSVDGQRDIKLVLVIYNLVEAETGGLGSPDWRSVGIDCSADDVVSCARLADFVFSVGKNVFSHWDRELRVNKVTGVDHRRLVPAWDEFSNTDLLSPSLDRDPLIVTYDNRDDNTGFMEATAAAVGMAASKRNVDITWKVYLPRLEESQKRERASRWQGLTKTPLVRLVLLEYHSRADIEKSLAMATICVQAGEFLRCGYSGMEAIMAGVPTLVPKTSAVGRLIDKLVGLDADLFLLKQANVQRNDDEWTEKILQFTDNLNSVQKKAREMKQKILENEEIQETLRSFIGVFTESSESQPTPHVDPGVTWSMDDFLFDRSREYEIGRGSFGTVYRGHFREQEAAIKVVDIDARMSDKYLFKEVTVIKRLLSCDVNVENIIKTYGWLHTEHALFVAMELAKTTMQHRIIDAKRIHRQRKVSLDCTEQIREAIGCWRGLKYLHSVHVIHQDIKPSNILFTSDGQAKLADFGMARITRPMDSSTHMTKTEMGSSGGTLWYSAPEVMVSERPQRWSDVWSMCATLVEWFSLRDLWLKTRGNVMMLLLGYVTNKETPHGLKQVGDERVRGILSLGLVYNKRKRPSAEELARHMEELLNKESPNHERLSPSRETETSLKKLVASPCDTETSTKKSADSSGDTETSLKKVVASSHETETARKKHAASSHETDTSLKKLAASSRDTETSVKKPLALSQDPNKYSGGQKKDKGKQRADKKAITHDLGVDMRPSISSSDDDDDDDNEDDEADEANTDEERALTQYGAGASTRQNVGSVPRHLDHAGMRFHDKLAQPMLPGTAQLQIDQEFAGKFQNMWKGSEHQRHHIASRLEQMNMNSMKSDAKQQHINNGKKEDPRSVTTGRQQLS